MVGNGCFTIQEFFLTFGKNENVRDIHCPSDGQPYQGKVKVVMCLFGSKLLLNFYAFVCRRKELDDLCLPLKHNKKSEL